MSSTEVGQNQQAQTQEKQPGVGKGGRNIITLSPEKRSLRRQSPLHNATRLYRRSKKEAVREAKAAGTDVVPEPAMKVAKFEDYGVKALRTLLNEETSTLSISQDLMDLGSRMLSIEELSELEQADSFIKSSLDGGEHCLDDIITCSFQGMGLAMETVDYDESLFDAFWSEVGLNGDRMGFMRRINNKHFHTMDLKF
jgi:hypothetical protein